ncbi:hypothetical protein EGW08_002252 [Elysia chlorotica]|uniref:G-protein coupled receptors family 1 profile domain-containing protein n=1 Tax=Elysia chlorotica TaxID=188477 RepID=A0A3S0ZYR3_ELYCH|nr:hypothetical protein EGW08_002252 [Elysia chlorotica]
MEWIFNDSGFGAENETSLVPQLVSLPLRDVIMKVNGTIILLLALAGIPNNILNILTFSKLDINFTIKISFVFLSSVDLCSSVNFAFLAMILLDMSRVVELPVDLQNAQRLAVPVMFSLSALGSWDTACISLERCCCVVFPTKVRNIFTRKITIALLAGMLLVQTTTLTINMASIQLIVNNTLMNERPKLLVSSSIVDTIFVSLILGVSTIPSLICFATITASTIFLAVSLKKRNKWLNTMHVLPDEVIDKNKKLVRTVVAMATIHIACSLPAVFLILTFLTCHHLNPLDKKNEHLSHVLATVVIIFQALSGMVNILIYFQTNAQFHQSLQNLLCLASANT